MPTVYRSSTTGALLPFWYNSFFLPPSALSVTVSGVTACAGCIPSYNTANGTLTGTDRRYFKYAAGTVNATKTLTNVTAGLSAGQGIWQFDDAALQFNVYSDPTCTTLEETRIVRWLLVYTCSTRRWSMYGQIFNTILSAEAATLFRADALIGTTILACDCTDGTLAFTNGTGACGAASASPFVVVGTGGSVTAPICV